MSVILINCCWGNGSLLRSVEVAVALNAERERSGESRLPIITPLLYGERQERILTEEFGDCGIEYDMTYGAMLSGILYSGEYYQDYLTSLLAKHGETQSQIQEYIRKQYGADVLVEIGRAPLVRTGDHPAYWTTFAKASELLAVARDTDEIAIDPDTCTEAIALFREVEQTPVEWFMTQPGSQKFKSEERTIDVPPTLTPTLAASSDLTPGIYVTASGIKGLDALYAGLQESTSVPLYTNNPDKVRGATSAPPSVIGTSSILLHIARPGWGAVWQSLLTETPFVALPYDRHDDPEIYCNTLRVEELEIGRVYRGEPLDELLESTAAMKDGLRSYKQELLERYGTLDGAEYTAQKIWTSMQA